MENITISIVIPVYNVEQYLHECLDSIVNQIEKPEEVILINDGSTDSSVEICLDYCKKYHNFSLIQQDNSGQGTARNVGLKYCHGDYILFIDADDFVSKHLIGTVKQNLKEYRYDILLFSADIQYDIVNGEAKNAFIRLEDYNNQVLTGKEYLERTYPIRHIETVYQAVYKRSFIEGQNIRFPEGMFFEDSLFILQVLLAAKKVFSISDQLYTRRYRMGSTISEGINLKKADDLIMLNRLIWKTLQEYGMENLDRRFVLNFVSGNLLHAWNMTRSLNQMKKYKEKIRALFQDFLMEWGDIYKSSKRQIGDAVALFLALNESQEIKDTIFQREIEDNLKFKFKNMPLYAEDKRVIIYGTGVNATALIELCSRFDDIRSSMEFMVTDDSGGKMECQAKKVLFCKDIQHQIFDAVVISSRAYQEDIYEELIRRNVAKEKIIMLYDKTDVCDLSVIWRVLNV